MTKMMAAAEKISRDVEACAIELLDKLCADEPRSVRDMAWSMLATRLAFAAGAGDCFVLPPLDEV